MGTRLRGNKEVPEDTANFNLQDLIEWRRNRRTYEQLAEAAGGLPGRSAWLHMARGEVQNPRPDGVRGIAKALGVSELMVWLAIGRSNGLTFPRRDDALMQRLTEDVRLLSTEQVDAIMILVESLVAVQMKLGRLEELEASSVARASHPDAPAASPAKAPREPRSA